MPLLIIHAAVALASLITPRRATAPIQRILSRIAVSRANARWLVMAGE